MPANPPNRHCRREPLEEVVQAYMRMLVLSIVGVTACNAQTTSPICGEFQRLMDLPYERGVIRTLLVASLGEGEYLNIDIDGDDISERIVGGCPASLQSGDPCILSVEYSKGDKQEISFEVGQRFFLFRHMAKVYAAVNVRGPNEGRGTRSVLIVDSNEIRVICQKL